MMTLTTFEYYSTNKQYWGDQSEFALIPLDGCVGPPVFLKNGAEPTVVGRNTFACNSELTRKVSRACLRVSVREGRVMLGSQSGSSYVRYRKSWSNAQWLPLGDEPVFLNGGASVEMFPGICGFEVRDLRPPASPEWVQQSTSGFTSANSKRRGLRPRKKACGKMGKENAVVVAATAPSLCQGCEDVVCSCVQSAAQEAAVCEWPNLTPPAILNVTGEATPPVRSRAGDYSDLEDDVRPHRARDYECPRCEQPYAGGVCGSCEMDPDSHEYQGM
jgi:hypothetical protein